MVKAAIKGLAAAGTDGLIQLKVSRQTAVWVLKEAQRRPSNAFSSTTTANFCKMCDRRIETSGMEAHIQEHQRHLDSGIEQFDQELAQAMVGNPDEIDRWLADAADALR